MSHATKGPSTTAPGRHQKRMGPAPFASFEDLSDELDSPEDKQTSGSVVRLPGIREDATPSTPIVVEQVPQIELVYSGISLVGAAAPPTPPSTTISSLSTPQESVTSTKTSLQMPSTPRIDISRASSSSHHDSRDSTPERELFEGQEQQETKLGIAFKEEGTLDLRSSTEELDFQDPRDKTKAKVRPASPSIMVDELTQHQRKDSQSSEIGLLSISGRTSRLSSIGSQGSAQSRLSNASHLSIISGVSGRSPSPHKMLLETSFCGPKSNVSGITPNTEPKPESDVLEKVLLSRQHDPREAILAEGITVEVTPQEEKPKPLEEKQKPKPVAARKIQPPPVSAKAEITITVDSPATTTANNVPKIPKRIIADSGIEYTYIPLKGPLPRDDSVEEAPKPKRPVRETKSATLQEIKSKSNSAASPSTVHKSSRQVSSAPTRKGVDPQYIRIKLKPDHMYSEEDPEEANTKPACLDLNNTPKKVYQDFNQIVADTQMETVVVHTRNNSQAQSKPSTATPPNSSPKPTRHVLRENKTPSPSLSRRSSFTSLFRSRETIASPESPTVPGLKRKNTLTGMLKDVGDTVKERTRSRSKSRERDRSSNMSTAPSSTESIDSKTKQQKSSVLSIFKPRRSGSGASRSSRGSEAPSPEVLSSLEVEFKFNADANVNVPTKKYYETPLHGESIRIPLHSPSSQTEDRSLLQELKSSSQSQESQDTVIDAGKCDAVIEPLPRDSESNITVTKSDSSKRQSSTSSENIVFSIKLGSNNDLFTTKLPKEKHMNKLFCDSVSRDGLMPTSDSRNGIVPEEFPQKQEDASSMVVEVSPKVEERSINDFERPSEENPTKQEIETPKKAAQTTKKKQRMSSRPDEEANSSESELEVEVASKPKEMVPEDNLEPERKGLVYQQDSFEDELPYVPTTLPLERSVAVPIVPVKQRGTYEMRTYPIDRPRSTTPNKLSTLEDYCEDVMGAINAENITKTIEKLKISLPKEYSVDRPTKAKSPRKPGSSTEWFAFTDKASGSSQRTPPFREPEPTPPPLPPKGMMPKEWINFEEIPERQKPPRRIQTIPSRSQAEVVESEQHDNIVYSYVNPEDCKCECHEIARGREHRDHYRDKDKQKEKVEKEPKEEEPPPVQEDEVPLLGDDGVDEDKSTQDSVERLKIDARADCRSIISDSSLDLSTSAEHVEANSSNMDQSLRTPFTGDLGVISNRSSIVSQDEPQSPDTTIPYAFPKPSS